MQCSGVPGGWREVPLTRGGPSRSTRESGVSQTLSVLSLGTEYCAAEVVVSLRGMLYPPRSPNKMFVNVGGSEGIFGSILTRDEAHCSFVPIFGGGQLSGVWQRCGQILVRKVTSMAGIQ